MLLSLFSIFDPSSGFFLNNWLIFSILYPIMKNFFFCSNNFKILILKLINFMNLETKIIKINFLFFLLIPIFLLILAFNVVGLLPFVFTTSSHLTFSLSVGLPMWLSVMLTGWMKYNEMFSHLVPLGCPFVLMPFMVLIETISLVIRPLTLSIRLMANLTAGHMIMVLLSVGALKNLLIFHLSVLSELVILVLEIAVAFIQPYVFFILLVLYTQEVSHL
uniref:ATP synthase subunit a n=1 Tax=Liposcelis paeta TaxID=209927 RepID=A0A096X746_9NEOP|nr:ATP synthase F0 subunit 6 [Liposcelis paeta]